MFKFKNKSLKAALLAMPLASVVALASCGPIADKIGKNESSTRFGFDQPNDGKLKFGIPWKDGARYDAMQDITKKWNNLSTVKDQKNKDFLPIEIEGYTGYYDGMSSQVEKDISTKNTQKGLNLLFNYSGLASILNKYDMLLNLANNPDLKQTIENTYVSDFLKAGNLMSGVDPNGIYLIPAVKSGKTLGIDTPLLAYFVDQATQNGSATIKPEDKTFFADLKRTDQAFIAKTWGSYTKIPLNNGGLEGYEFSKSKLENYNDLFDLALRIKKSFPSSNNDDGLASKGRWLVGVNDSASHWFISSFQVGNGDFKNYIVDFGPNVKSFDYRVTKKGTPAYENGKQAFDLFENLQKDDAVIYEGNAPKNDSRFEVSTIQKKHLLPFALMSTTSYSKKYEAKESDDKMNADELMLLPEPTKTFETETKKSITSQGPSIMAMHANAQEDKATENFLKWFISEPNTFEYKDKSGVQTFTGTANDYFAFRSNYLNPTKSNLTSDYESNNKLPHNPMFKLLFDTFKTVVNDSNEYSVYSEPGDATSQAFRKAVQTAFGSIGNQLKSNNNDTSKINFDTFLSELKKSSNGVIK